MRRLIPYNWFEKFRKNVVVNEETNTTEIGGNAEIDGDLKVNGTIENKGVLLWENQDVFTAFPQTTLNIDFTKFNYIVLVFKKVANPSIVYTNEFQKIETIKDTENVYGLLNYANAETNKFYSRSIILNNSNKTILIGGAVVSDGTSDNLRLMPVAIYGTNLM